MAALQREIRSNVEVERLVIIVSSQTLSVLSTLAYRGDSEDSG